HRAGEVPALQDRRPAGHGVDHLGVSAAGAGGAQAVPALRRFRIGGPGMITTDTLKFLGELKKHNERPWFEKNKARYEASVRDAMLDLVADLQPRLKKVSKHVVVEPKSVMRIYRDVRFSKDKSPYKTYLGAMFWH